MWAGQVTDAGYQWGKTIAGRDVDMRGAVVAGWHRAVPSHYRPRADFFCKRGVPGSCQCSLSCDEIRQEWMDVAWLVRLANYVRAGIPDVLVCGA